MHRGCGPDDSFNGDGVSHSADGSTFHPDRPDRRETPRGLRFWHLRGFGLHCHSAMPKG